MAGGSSAAVGAANMCVCVCVCARVRVRSYILPQKVNRPMHIKRVFKKSTTKQLFYCE